MMKFFLRLNALLRLTSVVVVLITNQSVFAQLSVDAVTPQDAVNNILLGDGLTATNITFFGDTVKQLGSFECTNCNLGLPSGIIMTTGLASAAVGPNNSFNNISNIVGTGGITPDADLNLLFGGNKKDLCKLEFDFVPMGDSFVFEFVFGSDEYPEYTNQPQWNDVFGFFLSGPGISGSFSNNADNIALVPGTSSYVGIQTIHNGTTGLNGPCVNCEYYIHNGTGWSQAPYNSDPYYIQPDGFTTVLQAKAHVQCGETYHIKMAIADNTDDHVDSWVFLKAGSFASSSLNNAFHIPNIAPGGSVYEGCGDGNIVLTRPCGMQGELTIVLNYTGTATLGADYISLPNQIVIPAGEDSASIPFSTLNDAQAESTETVIVTATLGSIVGTSTLNILNTSPVSAQINDVLVSCGGAATLNLNISGGTGNHTIDWGGLGNSNPLIIQNPTNQTISYTVTDACDANNPATGTVNVTLVEYPALTVSLGNDITSGCNATYTLTPVVSGGNGNYSYVWTNNGEPFSTASSAEVAAQSGITIELTVTDGCGTTSSDDIIFIVDPQPIEFTLGASPITATCLQANTFEPTVTGGTGNYQYQWTVNGTNTGTTTVHTVQVNANSVVTLTVTDECGGYGQEEITILVPPVPVNIVDMPDVSVSCNDVFTLSPQVSGGAGNYSYSWTVNGNGSGNETTLTVAISQPSTITVNVTDQCGNQSSETVNVALNPSNLAVSITADDTDVCPNEEVLLTAAVTNSIGNVSYAWTVPGTGNQVTVSAPATTTYTVTVTDGCAYTATNSYTMQVWPNTPLSVPSEGYKLCPNTPSGSIVQGGVPPYTFVYNSSELSMQGESFIGNIAGTTATVTVTDHCHNEATFDINIASCLITIPNVFTPNNDNANKTFVIVGIEAFQGSTLQVFNRWGKMVFESDNYHNEWSGSGQEEGTYFYILKRSDRKDFSGYVQLVR